MNEKLDAAIENLLGQIRTNMKPDDAPKIARAVYELVQSKQMLMALSKK